MWSGLEATAVPALLIQQLNCSKITMWRLDRFGHSCSFGPLWNALKLGASLYPSLNLFVLCKIWTANAWAKQWERELSNSYHSSTAGGYCTHQRIPSKNAIVGEEFFQGILAFAISLHSNFIHPALFDVYSIVIYSSFPDILQNTTLKFPTSLHNSGFWPCAGLQSLLKNTWQKLYDFFMFQLWMQLNLASLPI